MGLGVLGAFTETISTTFSPCAQCASTVSSPSPAAILHLQRTSDGRVKCFCFVRRRVSSRQS
jgi:tRNA(Arg) A34 adenosine deaminase TadA